MNENVELEVINKILIPRIVFDLTWYLKAIIKTDLFIISMLWHIRGTLAAVNTWGLKFISVICNVFYSITKTTIFVHTCHGAVVASQLTERCILLLAVPTVRTTLKSKPATVPLMWTANGQADLVITRIFFLHLELILFDDVLLYFSSFWYLIISHIINSPQK